MFVSITGLLEFRCATLIKVSNTYFQIQRRKFWRLVLKQKQAQEFWFVSHPKTREPSGLTWPCSSRWCTQQNTIKMSFLRCSLLILDMYIMDMGLWSPHLSGRPTDREDGSGITLNLHLLCHHKVPVMHVCTLGIAADTMCCLGVG